MGYEELAHLGMVEFHEASMRMGEERGRQQGRQEGEQQGELRTLLSVASRIVSPSELEHLTALPLEQLRVEVEARIAALAAQQREG